MRKADRLSFFPAAAGGVSIALALLLVNAFGAAEPPRPMRILALGDSLTAGYGLPAEASFPAVLERELRDRGVEASVVNAGVSGDTSAGGRARLPWLLAEVPDAAIVELGANDALRGLDPGALEENLRAVVRLLQERGVRVLLAGMRAPRNLGAGYARRFDAVYPRLAETEKVALYPFFLEGVAGVPERNLDDGIHPNEEGVREIVRRILPAVLSVL